MVPSSCRMTRGEPDFAHLSAQSLLMGFESPFVKAQAESSTQPVTVFVVPVSAAQTSVEPKRHARARLRQNAALIIERVYTGMCRGQNSLKQLGRHVKRVSNILGLLCFVSPLL